MKQPYEIHSDFFKKMIALGWYENREIILDSLPHHLEELPDNVKKFLREIWYLTISYDGLDDQPPLRITEFKRDILGRLIHTLARENDKVQETVYQYDLAGNLVRAANHHSITCFDYNGNRTAMTCPSHKPQSVQKEWLTYLTQEDIFFQRQRNNYLP